MINQLFRFDSEKYVLNVSFCPAIEHMLAKDYKLKVVLPVRSDPPPILITLT